MGRAGGDEDAFALEGSVAKLRLNSGDNLKRFGHAPRSKFAAGHVTVIRAHHGDAIAAQRGDVALCRGVLPHAHIHRRRQQYGRVGGQQQGRGQIIRRTLRHLGHQISRGGGDHQQVCRAAKLDVAHLGLIPQIEKIAKHLHPGQGRDGKRGHELFTCAGQNRGHLGPAFAQAADQIEGFIGGNATADDQQNMFARQHKGPPFAFGRP